jgi:hypothetical protein
VLRHFPSQIPIGYVFRVRVSSWHAVDSGKKLVHCHYGAAQVFFAMEHDAMLERLKARAADWMKQRAQGPDWTIAGEDREAVDFEHCYEVIPKPGTQEVHIFVKQVKITVKFDDGWTAVSDRLVDQLRLPRGAQFRLYPVNGEVQRVGDDDHAYTFEWEEGHQ